MPSKKNRLPTDDTGTTQRVPCDTESASDPLAAIECVADLWLGASSYTLHSCMCVSSTWRAAIRLRLRRMRTASISSLNDGVVVATLTGDRVVRRLLSSLALQVSLTELSLHGLANISDAALRPLSCHRHLHSATLTYCVKLTCDVRHHLPSSLRHLDVAGCFRMYSRLHDLSHTLDIHICEDAVREVEEQALAGFRFTDPAMRAGIRLGALCTRAACTGSAPLPLALGHPCARIPDACGVVRTPELWHASSFDWHFCDTHKMCAHSLSPDLEEPYA
jgi:hypothetical protein